MGQTIRPPLVPRLAQPQPRIPGALLAFTTPPAFMPEEDAEAPLPFPDRPVPLPEEAGVEAEVVLVDGGAAGAL